MRSGGLRQFCPGPSCPHCRTQSRHFPDTFLPRGQPVSAICPHLTPPPSPPHSLFQPSLATPPPPPPHPESSLLVRSCVRSLNVCYIVSGNWGWLGRGGKAMCPVHHSHLPPQPPDSDRKALKFLPELSSSCKILV